MIVSALALRARTFSRALLAVLLIPILVGAAVGPVLAGQAKDAPTTLLVQLFSSPGYRPYLILLVCVICFAVLIEIFAAIEEQRNGGKDLKRYLKEIVKKNEMLAPDHHYKKLLGT